MKISRFFFLTIFIGTCAFPGTVLADDCYESTIMSPAPFLGNSGEIFKLSDGSIWEVRFEYNYLYEYYPTVVVCPNQGTLTISDFSNEKIINVVLLINSAGVSIAGDCYESTIVDPVPFLGNSGEIFELSDGSVWEVGFEYEYLYEYYPTVVVCPNRGILGIDGETLDVRLLSAGSPSSFSVPTVQASDGLYSDKIVINWTASTNATFYQVAYSKTFDGSRIDIATTTGEEMTITGAEPGVVYYFWITPADNNSSGIAGYDTGYVAEVTANTDGPVDTDRDGLANDTDRDDDNDGMPDRYEVVAGHDPLVDDAGEVGNNNGMTNLEVYLALPKSNQYLQNTTASPNIARLHIVNTSENAQSFTGTIFDKSGDRLGNAYQSLGSEVPPKGRLVLDSSDFESLFSIDPWKGPAMVEVVGTDNFSLMSKLVSRSGLISNTNCVRENRVLNLERYDPDAVTYVRLINTSENAMGSIKGTLYDSSGNIVGSADIELVSSLLPKQMVWINILQFEQLFGQQWDGEALLEVTDIEGLKLLNLNLINGETFFNFSCFESGNETETGRVYLQTSTTGPNISMTHIVNTSQTSQQFTATMYNKEGERLGAANQVLGNAASKGRVIVSTADLEEIFGVSPWKGPSMLEVSGSASFELMTKQTSRSGLVSNVNCVRQNQVHNIEGMDSSDITYIRFINTSDTAINNVIGTLYDSNGSVVGPAGQTLLETIAPKEQVFINRNDLIDIFDGATWNGEVMMEVESDEALRLLNLNFINSETFFNFSCYEASN